jgi:hypothetical protein
MNAALQVLQRNRFRSFPVAMLAVLMRTIVFEMKHMPLPRAPFLFLALCLATSSPFVYAQKEKPATVAMKTVSTAPTKEIEPLRREGDSGRSSSTPANPDLKDLLESKIRAAWIAFKNKNERAYAKFLADDFIAVYADGEGLRDKPHVLSDVDVNAMIEVKLSNFSVVPLSPEAAFATYEAFLQFPPKRGRHFERVYIGEIWVKRDGQWKALHYQETRVP